LATVAPVASRSVSVILAPPCTMSTVASAVTAWSGEETGAAASLVATGTGRADAGRADAARADPARADPARADPARDGGYIAAAKDPLGTSSGSGVP
jgi:hypothetical protein